MFFCKEIQHGRYGHCIHKWWVHHDACACSAAEMQFAIHIPEIIFNWEDRTIESDCGIIIIQKQYVIVAILARLPPILISVRAVERPGWRATAHRTYEVGHRISVLAQDCATEATC